MHAWLAKIQAVHGARARGWLLACLAGLASMVALVRVDGGSEAVRSAGHALLTAAPLAGAWLVSAFGLGAAMGARAGSTGLAARFAMGMAALLSIDQWCGTLGLFHLGTWATLAALAPGWWLAARARFASSQDGAPAWACVAWGLAGGAMLAAALVPAGYMWSTEFGGYDALSYHLQVPREWLRAGSMRPLPHLAYAGLPNFVEGAFMHLMALRLDVREAAIACQLLHAAMALTAAATLREAVRGVGGGAVAGDVAALALLATPWVTVTGSLAYSESGLLLAMALGMRVATWPSRWASGLASGLALAVMVGSKASSVILAAPAALAWAALASRHARDVRWWSAVCLSAALALFPWMVRDAALTSNPFFPLWAERAGLGWWSAEQAARFAAGHRSDAGWTERLWALWSQGPAFGIGPNPVPGEPWRWLWGPLPWIGLAAMALLPALRVSRRLALASASMLALTCVGWLAATHLQSRFLLPAALPLAAATGLGAGALATAPSWRRVIVLAAIAWALLPAREVLTDRPGRLALAGRVDLPTGELDLELLRGSDDEAARAVRAEPSIEAALARLFPGARVLSVGWSTPFWASPSTPLRWSTVWDTNPLETALQQPDPEAWLRERFDLLLIDEPMLRRWKASGWLAPALDPDALQPLLAGRESMTLAGGRRLVSLQGALHPQWPERPARLPAPGAY